MTNACQNLDPAVMLGLAFLFIVGLVLLVAGAMVLFTFLARWLGWGKPQ